MTFKGVSATSWGQVEVAKPGYRVVGHDPWRPRT